nr:HlyD family secretion protein [Deltaproteobacteria bacterium]
ALLVPQRAVTRDQAGRAQTLVVTAANKVERRQLVTERELGDAWLVTSGIEAGDRVIVEGVQKVRPGADVKPVPAGAPAKSAGVDGGRGSGGKAPPVESGSAR